MSARKVSKSGKVYYSQKAPEFRRYERKVFQMRQGEPDAFAKDAKVAGFESAIAYLRHLWNADRATRELPAWEPDADSTFE